MCLRLTSLVCLRVCVRFSTSEEAVNELIKEAKTRWLREEEVIDDTTVAMACIGGWRGGTGGADPKGASS